MKERKLTSLEVIEMIKEINLPIAKIERDIGIPQNVLARANSENTKKPLPIKYEDSFIEYYTNFRKSKEQSSQVEQPSQNQSSQLQRKKEWIEIIKKAKNNLDNKLS